MSRDVEWSAEERQRAQTVLQNDARALHENTKSNVVSQDTCAAWREQMHAGDCTPRDVDTNGHSRSAVRKHVTGRCTHTTGPVFEYVDGEWRTTE